MSRPRLVVVGAGQAGVTAVETLRSEGFDGSVTLARRGARTRRTNGHRCPRPT